CMTVTAPDLAALPALDVAGRIDRLRAGFPEAGIDALFVTRLVNVRYLTGFTGSAALLLVGPDEVLFVSDGRYRDQSADQLAAAGVPATIEISGTDQKRIVHDAAQAKGYGRVGLEAHGDDVAAGLVDRGRLHALAHRLAAGPLALQHDVV